MDKLWRILYSPRRVYDELSTNVQVGLPLMTILGVVAISTLAIAFLAPTPPLSSYDLDPQRMQLGLVANEANLEYAKSQRDREPREAIIDSPSIPAGIRVSAAPWEPLTQPLIYFLCFVWAGTCFLIVGRAAGSGFSWRQWFGFVWWAQIPLIFGAVADVTLAAFGLDRPIFPTISIGELAIYGTTTTIWFWWSFIIEVQGLKSWTSKGIGACIGLALLANLLIAIPIFLVLTVVSSIVSSM